MKTIANSQFFRILFERQKQVFSNELFLNLYVKTSMPAMAYKLTHAEGACKLEADSEGVLLQGMGLVDVAIKSGHLGDYLGEKQAAFPCRWIHYPGSYDEEVLCGRLLQMGYNGVIVDQLPEAPKMFSDLGIQIIWKPDAPELTPLDQDWDPGLGSLDHVQAIYWKGTYMDPVYNKHPAARDDLQIDLALREVQALEALIDDRCSLIYEIDSSSQIHWIPELMDSVGNKTLISFSAIDGKPTEDHKDYHPLWKLLRELPDTSATRLLPILNMGGVDQGEGVWPIIPIGLLEYTMNHMRRQPFAGAVVMTRHLSKQGTFLDGALWTAGHALWGEHSPSLLLETWCKAFHPSLASLEVLADFWKVGRRLSELKEVRTTTTEECRSLSESLIGELNRLQILVDKGCDQKVRDYFVYFARDARRKILHFLQVNHAPMVNVLNGDDLLESFWTVIQQSGGSGLTSGAKVTVLEKPQKGEEGSVMRQIYNEVVCPIV